MEFKNLKQLMTYLQDEKRCREYYALLRWGGCPVCPHCDRSNPYLLKSGKYRCSSKSCKKDFSVTKGTIFEKSHIPLSTWMGAMFLITGHKKGISSHQLARDMGVTQKTAWFILHRIRHIFGDPAPPPLENIVEVDETYVGGKFANMNRGKRAFMQKYERDNKTAVMGLLERDGKARLTVIGRSSFKEVVRDNVNSNAVIIYHQVSPKHLQAYCEETSYRYNSRKITDKDRFVNTMMQANGHRLTYKTLIQKTTENEKLYRYYLSN